MKILYTAFNGKENSSKLLLDRIESNNKLYLTNSFTTSIKQLERELKNNKYDLIISFGQFSLDKDVIQIEIKGKQEDEFITNFNYENLKNRIEQKYMVNISSDAGNYLCNNLYYHGLKYIYENSLETNMLFIHIPKNKNISNIDEMASIFNYLNY